MEQHNRIVRWGRAAVACIAAGLVTAACSDKSTSPTSLTPSASASRLNPATGLPAIGHVFILVLENEDISATFGKNSPATYLTDTLVPAGAFLSQYYGIGHASLDNYTALVSGQAPDSATQADCDFFTNFKPSGPLGGWNTATGQIKGAGCVFPRDVWTIGNQLHEAKLSWKAYMEDMGNDPTREADRCGHVPIGSEDITNNQEPEDQYAARHNPFVWFHSIIDSHLCDNVVPLANLEADLWSTRTTPDYVFITPNVCHDGHDAPCITGEPGGLVSANLFLKHWVPLILNSPAYKKDGALIIISDESEGDSTGANRSTACCNEQPGPNAALPGGDGPGGGNVGGVVISRFVKPGTKSSVPYNHYSLLKTTEDVFQLVQHHGQHYLGFAGQPGLVGFGSDIWTNPSGK